MGAISELVTTLDGGKRVSVHFSGHVVTTDQPVEVGGEDSAPSPYALFLASLGACAGFYVQSFCQKRGLPSEGIRVVQRMHNNAETGMLDQVELVVETPADFPDKYSDALVRVVDQCAVKRAIAAQPQITCVVQPAAMAGAATAPAQVDASLH